MRQITVKYPGECKKCYAPLAVGAEAIYEKKIGMWCLGCAPTDIEEIREVRQEAHDRKADKYEEWAHKRQATAQAIFDHNRPMTSDWAFITQPGRIPIRERINAQEHRQMESLQTARKFEEKAAALRKPPAVAGDAETKRQRQREWVRARLVVGMEVDTAFFGMGTVKKINKKTATIEGCGTSRTFTTTIDLSFIIPPRGAEACELTPIAPKPPRPTRQERIDAAKALCAGKAHAEIPAEVWATSLGYLAGSARELVIEEHRERYNI